MDEENTFTAEIKEEVLLPLDPESGKIPVEDVKGEEIAMLQKLISY